MYCSAETVFAPILGGIVSIEMTTIEEFFQNMEGEVNDCNLFELLQIFGGSSYFLERMDRFTFHCISPIQEGEIKCVTGSSVCDQDKDSVNLCKNELATIEVLSLESFPTDNDHAWICKACQSISKLKECGILDDASCMYCYIFFNIGFQLKSCPDISCSNIKDILVRFPALGTAYCWAGASETKKCLVSLVLGIAHLDDDCTNTDYAHAWSWSLNEISSVVTMLLNTISAAEIRNTKSIPTHRLAQYLQSFSVRLSQTLSLFGFGFWAPDVLFPTIISNWIQQLDDERAALTSSVFESTSDSASYYCSPFVLNGDLEGLRNRSKISRRFEKKVSIFCPT